MTLEARVVHVTRRRFRFEVTDLLRRAAHFVRATEDVADESWNSRVLTNPLTATVFIERTNGEGRCGFRSGAGTVGGMQRPAERFG